MKTAPFKAMVYLLALLGSSSLWAADSIDGKTLFGRHCAACHGLDGAGGTGVPLSLPVFLHSVTDDYLHTTIQLGRPGRVMPAFQQLGEENIAAIVRYMRSWAPGSQPRLSKKRILGNPEHGAELYAANCAVCHGANGEGGSGTGVTFSRPRGMPIMPPALNNRGFLTAASDDVIKATLMNGRAGTPMVSFLERGLSEQDIEDVVSYVRDFERHHQQDDHREQVRKEPPMLVYESSYDLKTTVENVKAAAEGMNFRLIREQYLEDGLVEAGQEDPGQVIVYVCNFKFLYDAMAIDPRVGLFLPCRITVVERDGRVEVMSINPKRLSLLFNNDELDHACKEMYRIYNEILEVSTL